MDKETFIQALADGLAGLPEGERRRALAFYGEAIDDRVEDGMTEAEAVAAMGAPADIAREALAALGEEARCGGPAHGPAGRKDAPGAKRWTGPAEGIQRVTLAEIDRDVRVLPSGDDDIRVEYEDGDDGEVDIAVADGELRVRRRWRGRSMLCWTLSRRRPPMALRLPDGLAADVTAATENGDVVAEGITLAGSLILRAKNGDARAERLEAWDAALSTLNGDVGLSSAGVRAVELSSRNGGISAENVKCVGLRAENARGDIKMVRVTAEGEVTARTAMGDVEAWGLSVGARATLHSQMGDVKGVLSGRMADYAIAARTAMGASSLPQRTSGDIPLDVGTSMGKIDIDFAGE